MALTTGTRLGPYEILGPLGVGGMGEVYRARDPKLNRDVAIKVLPEAFARDADRMGRFTREAQTLAALNHPNIAHIHGLEESGGLRALVMELVEGDDLSVLIARGPIPIKEALSIAKQIADALEVAHEQGIVHRDLKPANIKVRGDGTVKVLDFGLAKALRPEGASAADPMHSPTLTRGTELGMIIGTAAYMSPEQARGKAVDRRADIWSFGVVLYEMLTGRRTFKGDDVSEVLASVLKTEPDWSAVSGEVPLSVRRLLRRCLEKEPRKRLSAIGDARLELDEIEPAASETPGRVAQRRPIASLLWPAAAGIVATAAFAAVLWPAPRQVAAAGVTRLSVVGPAGAELYPDSGEVAISPDGRMVAFVVGDAFQKASSQLWVRAIDSVTARRLEWGDGAHLPFWSPDSRHVGFGADGKLKRVPAAGGRAVVICAAPNFRGAAWNVNDVIVFGPDAGGPIHRVSANGGEPAAATTLDPARKESGHRFPVFLPDGDHFLFAAMPVRAGKFDIFAGSLRDGTRSLVASMESAPVYAEPGWLLFARGGVLAAQPFDAGTRKVTGEAVALEDEPGAVLDAGQQWTAGYATSVSSSGALAYFSGSSLRTTAVWLDAGGKPAGSLALPVGRYTALSISPDGGHAVFIRSFARTESSLWLVDLQRGGAAPLSIGGGRNESPAWSPDGTRVAFASDRDGARNLFVKGVADATPERLLYRSDAAFKTTAAWSPDGKWIVFHQLDAATDYNIYLLPVSGDVAPTSYVRGPMADLAGSISPDGKAMAYLSEESGTLELYAQSFPSPGRRARISTAGALSSWWTHDGRQVIYRGGNRTSLMVADVEPATLRIGTPRLRATLPAGVVAVDAMPDRQRWIALMPETAGAGTVMVVQNWMAGLKR